MKREAVRQIESDGPTTVEYQVMMWRIFSRRLFLFTELIFSVACGHANAQNLSIDEHLLLVIPSGFRVCNTDDDCALVHEVCGAGWRGINSYYQKQAQQLVADSRVSAACPVEDDSKAKVLCVGGLCEIVPDRDHCMVHHANGACAQTCDMLDDDGTCARRRDLVPQ